MRAILPARPPNLPAGPLESLDSSSASFSSAADADAAVPSRLNTTPQASASRALCSSSDSELSESDPASDGLLSLLVPLLLLPLLESFRRFFCWSDLLMFCRPVL